MKAPVVVFAYRRPIHLRRVLAALAANPEASTSEVIVFCDGPRSAAAEADCAAARAVARSAQGFKSLRVVERTVNLGLSRSIERGVSEVCDEFGRTIVLEDDVVPGPHFLAYMNDALDLWANDDRVAGIGCYAFDGGADLPDTYFLRVPDCWGWGVWRRAWRAYEADGAALLDELKRGNRTSEFDLDGAYPYTRMLEQQIRGEVDSWAVRWYAKVFLDGKLVLYPRRSVTRNIGSDGTGTNERYSADIATRSWGHDRIAVGVIPVVECQEARESWKRELAAPVSGARSKMASLVRRLLQIARQFITFRQSV